MDIKSGHGIGRRGEIPGFDPAADAVFFSGDEFQIALIKFGTLRKVDFYRAVASSRDTFIEGDSQSFAAAGSGPTGQFAGIAGKFRIDQQISL